MTDGAWEVVGRNFQELPIGKTIGDALRDLIRARFPHHAAKKIEARWGLDPKTARNVVTRGHVSERTLTKAARSERWELWMALGEELFGQPYREWEEERVTKIIEEAGRDLERVRRLRPLAAALPEPPLANDAARVLERHEGDEPSARREGGAGVRTAGRGDR